MKPLGSVETSENFRNHRDGKLKPFSCSAVSKSVSVCYRFEEVLQRAESPSVARVDVIQFIRVLAPLQFIRVLGPLWSRSRALAVCEAGRFRGAGRFRVIGQFRIQRFRNGNRFSRAKLEARKLRGKKWERCLGWE